MLRTEHFGSEPINMISLEPVEKSDNVENFPNGSEPACELKIRRSAL